MEWSVKHRPSKWSDIVGQTHITRVLADGLRTGNFPVRILMSGPPGTGKSSIAELSAKALMCDNLNDINPCGECASCLNKRLIKKFNMGEYNKKRSKYSKDDTDDKDVLEIIHEIFNYESIEGKAVYILEEINALSKENQIPFLEEMTKMPENVYIILCTNHKYEIIKEMRDRCIEADFTIPSRSECVEYAKNVIISEHYPVPSDESLKDFCNLCHNEPRKIINYLQLFSSNGFSSDNLREFFNIASNAIMDSLLELYTDKYTVMDMVNWFNELETQESLKMLNNMKGYLLSCLTERTANKSVSSLTPKSMKTLDELGESNLLYLMDMIADLPKSAFISDDSAKFSIISIKMKMLKSKNTISNTNTTEASIAKVQSLRNAKILNTVKDETNASSLDMLNLVDNMLLGDDVFSEDTGIFSEEDDL